MNVSRGLVTLTLLVAGLLAATQTGDGAPSAAGDVAAGKEVFTTYCSICHGVGGKGFIGPHIGGVNWTASGLHAIVRGGVGGYGGMPAFNADAVTDQNIVDIAAYLASLAAVPAPTTAPAIAPASTPPVGADMAHGHVVYEANCAACHGASGGGGVGPNLHGESARKDTAAAIAWIKHPMLPMPTLYPNPLSESDVDDVAAYIESL